MSHKNISILSDKKLMNLLGNEPHNKEAWGEFYHRFDRQIRSHCRRSLKPNSVYSVDDLVQSVYTTLLTRGCQTLKDFRGKYEGSFRAYLSQIIFHKATTLNRRVQRKPDSISIDSLGDGGYVFSDGGWSEKKLIASIHFDKILRILSPRQREIVWLRLFVGLSYSDIAAVRKESKGSVRLNFMRAKRKIRQFFDEAKSLDRKEVESAAELQVHKDTETRHLSELEPIAV
ncbi:MAG: hypothetical protein DKINENOH_05625 [bacterium]|nr:hypothetical protein [bacterium]